MRYLKLAIKLVLFLVLVGMTYFIYNESGFFTASIIFLICLELWGRRQIESSIAKFKNKQLEDDYEI